jgi:GR25 family glycosyltransferase involved in LPS biosynthesis
MKLNNIFVTTIERTKVLREKNLKKIGNFGQKYFDINVGYGGIDGSLLKQEEVQNYINQGIIIPSHEHVISLGKMIYMEQFAKARYMTSSEIGVFLSHFSFLNYIVQNNIECSLILEDDAYFNDQTFANQIKSVISDYDTMNFKLVSLFKHNNQKKTKNYRVFNNKYQKIDARCWGAVAYLITLDGAKQLLKSIVPIKTPVDFSMFQMFENLGDGFIIKESVVSLCDNSSSIRDNSNRAIEDTSFGVELKPIQPPKHIFSINNEKLKVDNYEVINIFQDFSKFTNDDLMKNIIAGIIMPPQNCDMSFENKNKIIFSNILKRFLTCDEISCYMSHYKIWQHIIEEKIPYAIVLGENFELKQDNFNHDISKIVQGAPFGFTTISLQSDCNENFSLPLKENPNYFLSSKCQHNAYIISLFGAIQFVKHLNTVHHTIDLALNLLESKKKTGYIYRSNSIKEIPTIIELNTKNDPVKIDELYYLGGDNTSLNIFNLNPYIFKIQPENINILNLINMNNGIIHLSLVENGNLMYRQENRAFTKEEISNYLSHISIWSNIVDKKINAALIINNGVKFISSDDKLKQLVDNIPHRGNLILFTNENSKKDLKCNEFYYHTNNCNGESLAYIITYKAAKELLKIHKPIRCPIHILINNYALTNKVGYIPKETFFI